MVDLFVETIEKKMSDMDNISIKPIMSRYWVHACSLATVSFIIYEIGIQYNFRNGQSPLCKTPSPHSNWSWFLNVGQASGLLTIVTILLVKKLRDTTLKDSSRSAYLSTFCCVCISSISSLLTLVCNWGGVCIDSLGVATPAAIWGEWLFCAPLLMFICVSIDDKARLSTEDIWLIIALFLSIFFGFLILFPQPMWLGAIWFGSACICYLMVYKLLYDTNIKLNLIKRSCNKESDKYQRAVELTSRKVNLVRVFAYLMPIYIIVYLLALFQIINFDQTKVAFQFSDLLTKGLFAIFAMDTHVELLHPSIISQVNIMRINEARRGFLKYIFHEVRVPLNSLTMGIEFLGRSRNLDEEEQESLLMMFEASKFMSETLNEVLNMQKIEEGKLELEFSPFSLKESIQTVIRTFQAPLRKHAIVLETYVPSDFPIHIVADRSRIEHVIANFLSNAIKFSPKESNILLNVTWKQILISLPPKIEVTVSVSDHGPGISEEDQKNLFTSFMQVRPGELQQGRGSGVGLFICKQLIHLHGGQVNCVSKVNQGSTFSFTIPCEYSLDVLDAVSKREAEFKTSIKQPDSKYKDNSLPTVSEMLSRSLRKPPQQDDVNLFTFDGVGNRRSLSDINLSAQSPPSHSPTSHCIKRPSMALSSSAARIAPEGDMCIQGTILVVDDVMSNRKMLKMLLEKKGIAVDMADDGVNAIALYHADKLKYSMIFMDNMMPRMDGVQTTKELRKAGFDRIIVGLTGCAMDDDIASYSNAGADMVLSKPISASSLESILSFVHQNGTLSRSGMRLIQKPGGLIWVPRN